MRAVARSLLLASIGLFGLCAMNARAHQTAASATADLTPEQQSLFTQARTDFGAEHWAEAAKTLSELHAAVPNNVVITKFLAEAQINLGQTADALKAMQPILSAAPEDVQALAITAHAYAQAHQSAQRDAALAHLQALHDSGATKLAQVIVEKDDLPGGGFVRIFDYLQPWSQYHITLMARVFDSNGRQIRRITLESGDFDQPGFAKEHPDLAAKGERRYSIDGYSEQAPGPNGTVTQTQALYGFYDGRPSYDTFRARVLEIMQKQSAPAATMTTVPQAPKQ